MSAISLVGAAKDFGLRSLFADLDLHVGERDRLGLIGPNGAGKSTLLRVLAGLEPLDRGERRCHARTRVVLLDQEPRLDPSLTVLEQAFAGDGEAMALLRAYAGVSHQLALHPEDDQLLARLSALQHRMDGCQAWDLERRCREVLERLGIDAAHQERTIGELSGGNRRRVALAAALVAEPEVLLLDEPTNHLDAEGVEWLQSYLDRFAGALVLVTHDRYLLDRVTRRIVAVERGEARPYEGNYGTYLGLKAAEEEAEASTAAKLKGTLRRELAWLRQGPKARSTKQKARLQRIDALLEAPARQGRTSLAMAATARRIGKRAITAEGLAVAVGERTLLRDFSYDFSPEDRVGIIGPNGVGKSSLLEVISGRRPPSDGLLELGATVKLAYFDQHSDVLLAKDGKRKVIEVVQEAASRVQVDGVELTASQLLERFLFPPAQQHQPVAKLSGGERRRLHLCRLLIEAPNVLLLDEPTNDLDVHTLSVLEEFLDDFRGCVVVVSHDRWFLDRTVDRLFHFEDGRLERFEGNYSSWLERRAESPATAPGPAAAAPETAKRPAPSAKVPADGPRRRSFKEARELERLETELPQLEQQRRELEQHLAAPSGPDYARLEELTHELAALVERIDAAEERWLVLSELAA
ncbi:ABC-F family ATP-binding cassette domain-containing protein [Cyanobium sp. Cruz CV13-4-11]|uniref:ABC-F family ATP-binding cassette domain-containing protein n=1 Tax=unclassified Cyanobium TaxID=2627006 RepID=UPI0020CCD45A|nr:MULTISPECIES: ABC-F family ATP-binding cassette domain-containing protein [unclassified Cyanobium]MCP9902012.1 ABC-F family ATP-binding cassette domain-containing protein [Cyanobium sp. Cruz CV11-17]MCP9920661.1 ABC-F family ATP-binding cassette domain-containing protein [Cyanobium sp. Cruz CV13-4-11]